MKKYETIDRNGNKTTIELSEKLFEDAKSRLFDSLDYADGIKADAFKGDKDAFTCYKAYALDVMSNVAHLAIAAKRQNHDDVVLYTDATYKAFGRYITIFGADLTVFGADVPTALLPHIGTFRKIKGTESEYQFCIVGETSFRKSLERTVADFIRKGHILTVEERRQARKDAAKAAREVKKAEKTAK